MDKKIRLAIWLLSFSGIVILLSLMFRIQFILLLLIEGIGLICCPICDRARISCKKAEREFYDLTSYMEQLLCSYKRHGSLVMALEDCALLFQEDTYMKNSILQAIHILRTGEGTEGNNIARQALHDINVFFGSRRLYMMHDFICHAEKDGGDAAEALDILMGDLQLWKQRTALYQTKKKFIRRECVLAAILSILLSGITRILVPSGLGFNLTEQVVYQLSCTIMLGGLFIAETAVFRKLTGSWLDKKEKEGKRAKKNNIEKEFPYWLLAVTLYLQQDSVYQAIRASLQHIHGNFKQEVNTLLEGMYEKPGVLEPFLHFFDSYTLPEIQTGMKILYSVNTNGYQETRKQVKYLIEQNNLIMDKYEQNRFENQMAGMGLLKQIPMVLACGKLLVDLGTLLILAMQTLQSVL